MQLHRSYFLQLPWSSENGFFQYPPQKSMDQGVGPTPPHGQVENVTAPSAGDSPGPDGGVSRRDRRGRRGRRGLIGKGECSCIEAFFCNYLGLQKTDFSNILPQKVWIRALPLRPPHGQVENVTAPSAGDSPGPDGEVGLRMRLPFRTAFSENGNTCNCDGADCRCCYAANGRVWISRRGRSAPVVWMARR
ncbi:MAG: hypothetical protein ACOX52_12500 [Verrucomicrobiota bacterium]